MAKINSFPKQGTSLASESGVAPLGSSIEVRGKLALLGWPSLADWGDAHGYSRAMTTYVVRTWGNKTKRPHGGIARHLMINLRKTIEEGRRPESLTPSQES